MLMPRIKEGTRLRPQRPALSASAARGLPSRENAIGRLHCGVELVTLSTYAWLFTMSTSKMIIITREQCRMARAALGLGVRDLAKLAHVAAMTVTRFENGRTQGHPDTLVAIRRALEKAGVIFIEEEDGDGPGVRLRRNRGWGGRHF